MYKSESIDGVWHNRLIRRLRVLLHTEPITNLRSLNLNPESETFHYDSITLAVFLLDRIIESAGLGNDADSNAVINSLTPIMQQMDAAADFEPDARRHEDFVRKIINRLKEKENCAIEYTDFDGTRAIKRKLEFQVIRERWASDERIVLELSPEAINIFLNALDLEVEDAQVALEAVIQYQLERGHFNEAMASARDAKFRSLQFGNKIEQFLIKTRRDISSVDWREMMPNLIREALAHIESRLKTEKHIADVARERLDELKSGSEEAHQVAMIIELMDDCSIRHTRLQGKLIDAPETFFLEQSRQSFAFRPEALFLPNLFADVLEPLVLLDKTKALAILENSDDSFEGAVSCLFGARQPAIFSLKSFISWSLRPRRPEIQTTIDDENEDWQDPMPDVLRYPPETSQAAQSYIQNLPTRLSVMLEKATTNGENQAVLEHICLDALQAFENDPKKSLQAEPVGILFAQNGFWGDDLKLSNDEEFHAEITEDEKGKSVNE